METTSSIILKGDPALGAYIHVEQNEAEDLAEYLEDLMILFLIDPDNATHLQEPGKRTFLFGEQNRHLIRNTLVDYGFEVLFGENLIVSEQTYEPPVAKLLTLGETSLSLEWPRDFSREFNSEHVPSLISMALDEQLHTASATSKALWAPVHAWRILGHLRAESAIVPLLHLLRRIDEFDDDRVAEELPRVFGMIGPAAIPHLAAYLADPDHGEWARAAAANALDDIGQNHPLVRAECVATVGAQLERFHDNSPTLNGLLVASLLDLKAVEAAPVIQRAFATEQVDESVVGDWEDVQIELGLKTQREHPRKPNALTRAGEELRRISELILLGGPLPPASPPFIDLKAINKANKKKRSLEKKKKKKNVVKKQHPKH
ncbi:MAG: lyase HEAT-like repeat protein [Pedosphaera sp.]|nr:lyase HEAT-like repeat protein [Pedosphaera sp.]